MNRWRSMLHRVLEGSAFAKAIAVGCCLLVVGCLLSSCSKAEEFLSGGSGDSEYSTWPCRFAYDNSVHLDATLAAAMDAGSRGVFCIITESTHGGKTYLVFRNSQGGSTEQPKTADEVQANFILGLNNGIIVGYQTLRADDRYGGYVGYDLQCPNCVRRENNTVNPTYRLNIDSKGIASCAKCGKTYDMNNGGIVRNGTEGDKGLEKYVAAAEGAYGRISVFRK